MAASFPGSIVTTFVTHQNLVESIDASHPNKIQDEVIALETYLGVNPHVQTIASSSGTYVNTGSTFATVAARLANIETGIVADSHSHYVHLRGGDTITAATAGTVALAIKAATSQTANLLQISDSTNAAKMTLDSNYRLTVAGGLTVSASGASITGDVTSVGAINAQRGVLTQVSSGQVGLVVKQSVGATADALQIQDSNGNVLFRIGPSGKAAAPLSQAFFIGGSFTAGARAARWIASGACTLTVGYARLDGGSSGVVKWGLFVNGVQSTTGGTSNLSGNVTQGGGVATYTITPVVLAAGDSVQLYIGSVTGTAADFSVTLGGTWAAA